MTASNAASTVSSKCFARLRTERATWRSAKRSTQRARCILGSSACRPAPTACAIVRKPSDMSFAMKRGAKHVDHVNSPRYRAATIAAIWRRRVRE